MYAVIIIMYLLASCCFCCYWYGVLWFGLLTLFRLPVLCLQWFILMLLLLFCLFCCTFLWSLPAYIHIPPPPPPPPPPSLLPSTCIATPMVWSVDKVSIFTTIQVRTCRKCLLMRCPWMSLTMARTPHRQQQLQRMESQWGRYELRCTNSHSKGCVPVTMQGRWFRLMCRSLRSVAFTVSVKKIIKSHP